ncbi:MAG: hypothetical protein ACT4OO_06550 [Nitrospiraceae bacterium]
MRPRGDTSGVASPTALPGEQARPGAAGVGWVEMLAILNILYGKMCSKGQIISLTATVFLLVGSVDGLAQTGALDHSPTEVVRKYLSLDAKGVRLDAKSFDAVLPYTSWTEEPVWGRVVVTQQYTVPENYKQWEIINMLEVIIPVEFRVLGSVYLETAAYLPEPTTERIRFRVKAVKNRWRIMEPIMPPHVGQKRMIHFVQQAMLQETEPSKVSSLALLRDELRKVPVP